jgi:hypothetical protein
MTYSSDLLKEGKFKSFLTAHRAFGAVAAVAMILVLAGLTSGAAAAAGTANGLHPPAGQIRW